MLQAKSFEVVFLGKAVNFLARKRIRRYTNHSCEGFFCSRLFVHVFVLLEIVFFGSQTTNAWIHISKMTNFLFVYL
jgi:hypothetical protein